MTNKKFGVAEIQLAFWFNWLWKVLNAICQACKMLFMTRHGVQSITVFWVIVIDWTDQKWSVIAIDYIANLIVIDDYFHH